MYEKREKSLILVKSKKIGYNKLEKKKEEVKKILKLDKDGEVQKFFSQTSAIHMDKYVPMREGRLADCKVGTDYILYDTPYAHYQYEGKVYAPNIPIKDKNGIIIGWWSKAPKYETSRDLTYSTTMHEYAGSHWDQRMWTAEGDEVIKELENKFHFGGK